MKKTLLTVTAFAVFAAPMASMAADEGFYLKG